MHINMKIYLISTTVKNMATAYVAYLTDMKAEVFLRPYKNLQ